MCTPVSPRLVLTTTLQPWANYLASEQALLRQTGLATSVGTFALFHCLIRSLSNWTPSRLCSLQWTPCREPQRIAFSAKAEEFPSQSRTVRDVPSNDGSPPGREVGERLLLSRLDWKRDPRRSIENSGRRIDDQTQFYF